MKERMWDMDEPKERRTHAEGSERQMASPCNAGKPGAEAIREYGPAPSASLRWCKAVDATGPAKAADNRTGQDGS
jgi:hypothetical protein